MSGGKDCSPSYSKDSILDSLNKYYVESHPSIQSFINHIVFSFSSVGFGIKLSQEELISSYQQSISINSIRKVFRQLKQLGLLSCCYNFYSNKPCLYYVLLPNITDIEALKLSVSNALRQKETDNTIQIGLFYGNLYPLLKDYRLTLLISKLLSFGRKHIAITEIFNLFPRHQYSIRNYLSNLVKQGFLDIVEQHGSLTSYTISDKIFEQIQQKSTEDFPEIIQTDESFFFNSLLNMLNYLITNTRQEYYATQFFKETLKTTRTTLDSVIVKACDLNILKCIPGKKGISNVYIVPERESYLLEDLKCYAGSFKKLPIYESLVEKTGSHELAIILNQIIYSKRQSITANQIRNLCLYKKTIATLHNKLDRLCDLGLLIKTKDNNPNHAYSKNLYSVPDNLFLESKKLSALIEEPDIEDNPDYLLAAIINKLRQYVLTGKGSLTISASYFKNLISSEKTISTIRLKLKALEKRGYIETIGRGDDNALKYRLNIDKFIEYTDKAALEAKTIFVLDLFKKYLESENKPFNEKDSGKWRISFKRMLCEGYEYKTLKHCIAYMNYASSEYSDVLSPAQIRFYYDAVKRKLESYSKSRLSKRIYDLLNGNIAADLDKVKVKLTPQVIPGSNKATIKIKPKPTVRKVKVLSDTAELAGLFIDYIKNFNDKHVKSKKSSYKRNFQGLLDSGYSKDNMKLVIAHLSTNIAHYDHINSFGRFRRDYNALYEDAVNGRLPIKETKPEISAAEAWKKAKELVDSERRKLKLWYSKQTAGVTDIDFEDYTNQALLFAYERFSKGKDDGYNVPAVKYRLDDYMYHKRNNDKSVKRKDQENTDTGVNNIIQYFDGDISEIIDRIHVETPEEYSENSDLALTCKNLLNSLDPRTAGIISDYHGLDGHTYTFKEIAARYGLSSDGYANRLYHRGLETLRSLPPPDI